MFVDGCFWHGCPKPKHAPLPKSRTEWWAAKLSRNKDRDRLVVLRKARKKLMGQRQAAEDLQVTERHVRRMLVKLKEAGDRSVIHGLRGRASNRLIACR